MDQAEDFLKKVNEQLGKSRDELKGIYNEVVATQDMIEPAILEMVKRVRNTRQTVSMELKQALTVMKDVRKFFLESDYQTEIDRLEKFVILSERLRELIDDGTLEVITDVAVKLAIFEKGDI